MGWFTVDRLEADTWAISEYRHWEETHCYLVCGAQAAALIDTGLGVENIAPVVRRLTSLPVRVLTTHAHWDHIGSHGSFTDIAVHEAERPWLAGRFPLPLPAVRQSLAQPPHDFPPGFDPAAYAVFQGEAARLLHDGDEIDLGGRVLTVLHTPGHSPGHCCFWEEARGTLFSGDLIYRGCLYAFYPTTDPALFARSVARVAALRVRRLCPGHHSLEVTPSLIRRTADAFASLAREGKLYQGAGMFDFGEVQLHL